MFTRGKRIILFLIRETFLESQLFLTGADFLYDRVDLSGLSGETGGDFLAGDSKRKFSVSLTKRHKGTERPFAMLSATFTDGFLCKRSTSEIILGARSAFSANCSCVRKRAFRCFLTICPKNFAKSLDNIRALCQSPMRPLQEQLFQF